MSESSNQRFVISEGFRRLVTLNAPLWGGEAEVIRSYWHSPKRNRDTDRTWLMRQMYKEFWDGIYPPMNAFQRALTNYGHGADRNQLLDLSHVLHEEVEHFCLFAGIYDLVRNPDEASPDPATLKQLGAWAGNDALMAVRAGHREKHGSLGQRAFHLSEGGYCSLFAEGMKLKGRGGIDDAIAEVCSKIYDDEFNHMLLGILDIDDAALSEADWQTLAELAAEQMQYRIRMRNEQFGYPLSAERIEELCAGKGTPASFDFAHAERLKQQRH